MKAAVYSTYGAPDVIAIKDVDKPAPGPGQVLIRVRATTVNRTDCAALRGTPRLARLIYGLRAPKNPVLGNEFAGEVESVGAAVTMFKAGDKVFGYNDLTYGGHAEYVTMAESGMLAIMPEDKPFSEAAPITEGAHYALKDIRTANVQRGQKADQCTDVFRLQGRIVSRFVGPALHACCRLAVSVRRRCMLPGARR